MYSWRNIWFRVTRCTRCSLKKNHIIADHCFYETIAERWILGSKFMSNSAARPRSSSSYVNMTKIWPQIIKLKILLIRAVASKRNSVDGLLGRQLWAPCRTYILGRPWLDGKDTFLESYEYLTPKRHLKFIHDHMRVRKVCTHLENTEYYCNNIIDVFVPPRLLNPINIWDVTQSRHAVEAGRQVKKN